MQDAFTYEPTPAQLKQLKTRAAMEGKTWQKYVETEVGKVMDKLAGGVVQKNILTTKEAGEWLGVSKYTVLRYVHQGLLPNTIFLNSRNVRITRGDLEQMASSNGKHTHRLVA